MGTVLCRLCPLYKYVNPQTFGSKYAAFVLVYNVCMYVCIEERTNSGEAQV
jgi:hypothetical protein